MRTGPHWAGLLAAGLFALGGVTQGTDCRCVAEVGSGPEMATTFSVGFTWRVYHVVPVGLRLQVGFERNVAVVQTCFCQPFCCPDPEAGRPFVRLDPVEIGVPVPDPIVPGVPRWETRTVSPVPEPTGDGEWRWIRGPTIDGQPVHVCTGRFTQSYAFAGAVISLSVAVGVGPVTVGAPILHSRGTMVHLTPGPCLPKNRPPKFVEHPQSVCLTADQEVTLSFFAVDPDPEDVVTVEPAVPWPQGVTVVGRSISQTTWESQGPGRAKLPAVSASFTIRVEPEYQGGAVSFVAVDSRGVMSSAATVPIVVVQPLEISGTVVDARWGRQGAKKFWEQIIEFVIHDPNPYPWPEMLAPPVITFSVGTLRGTGEAFLVGRHAGETFGESPLWPTTTLRVLFRPNPDATGEDDEVVLHVSYVRCATVTMFNGVPVQALVN